MEIDRVSEALSQLSCSRSATVAMAACFIQSIANASKSAVTARPPRPRALAPAACRGWGTPAAAPGHARASGTDRCPGGARRARGGRGSTRRPDTRGRPTGSPSATPPRCAPPPEPSQFDLLDAPRFFHAQDHRIQALVVHVASSPRAAARREGTIARRLSRSAHARGHPKPRRACILIQSVASGDRNIYWVYKRRHHHSKSDRNRWQCTLH
jgi:hypothetical protein